MASLSSCDPYPQLSAQIQEKFQANQQTAEIYDKKNRWRAEMEGIVRELYLPQESTSGSLSRSSVTFYLIF